MPRRGTTIFRFDPLADKSESDRSRPSFATARPTVITLSDGTRIDESRAPAQAVRVRQDRPALRQCRRAERQLHHAGADHKTLRGRRGRVRDGLDLAVHAAGRRHLSGAEARRSQSAARDFCARPAQLDGAGAASGFSRRRATPSCKARTAATCPTSSSRTRRSTRSSRASIMAGPIATTCRRRAPNSGSFLQSRGRTRSLCTANALYKAAVLAAAAARRAARMLYYHGAKFPELEGKLLVGLHGYRPTGSRVIVYDVDDHGFPEAAARRRCATMSVARPIRPTAFRPRRRRGRRRAVRRADRRLAQGQRRAAAGRAGRHDGRSRRRDLAGRGQEQDHHPHRSRRGRCTAAAALRHAQPGADRPSWRSSSPEDAQNRAPAHQLCARTLSKNIASAATRISA